MPGDSAFKVEGLVVQILPNGTCRIELANGHRLIGFVTGRMKSVLGPLSAGDRVKLQLSPYDLSQGRILERVAA